MARVMAIDVGERRIGVAVSDSLNIIAQGLEVIERKSDSNVSDKLESLIKEYNVSKIIVGMPLNMNGSKGASAKTAEVFASLLKRHFSIDIEMLDERLTTKQGERVLLEANLSRKKRKRSIDKIAAQLILQTYLDSHAQEDRP